MMGNAAINQVENFVVTGLTYIPMSNQRGLYTRPYTLTADGRAADALADKVLAQGSGAIEASSISDVVGSIVRPSAVAYQTTFTDSWFDDGHYLFFMTVHCTGLTGITTTYFIQGYTNHRGISDMYGDDNLSIDENMVHTVSSVIEVATTQVATPQGILENRKILSQYDVITNNTVQGIDLQRPDDIIDYIETSAISDAILSTDASIYPSGNDINMFVNAGNHINQHSDRVPTSSKVNNVASEYVSSVLNAGISNMFEQKHGLVKDEDYGFEYNVRHTNEQELISNRFLKFISRVEGYMVVQNTFTTKSLARVYPPIMDEFRLNDTMNKSTSTWDILNTLPSVEYMSTWNGQTAQSVAAYGLMNGAVSLAAKFGFSFMAIHIDNMLSVVNDFDIVISNFQSMIGGDENSTAYLVGLFKQRFYKTVYLSETSGGVVPLSCDIYVNLLGDTTIRISYAGGVEEWRSLSTMMATYMSPVIVDDNSVISHTANMFSSFISTVGDAYNYPNQPGLNGQTIIHGSY